MLFVASGGVIKRAVAYKVVISTIEKNKISDYIRYFLDSNLTVIPEDTGTLDEEGNPITIDYKYINIDYANIKDFMGQKLKITVYSYFDSGLIGYNQPFNNGLILYNRVKNKYLNIYNGDSNTTTKIEISDQSRGIYLLKQPFKLDGQNIYIYNHIMDTNPEKYNSSLGASYYNLDKIPDNVGINFDITPINNGIRLTNNNDVYDGYDAKVLKETELKTSDNTYSFDAIVPTIKIDTKNNNTINSIRINIIPSGIYGGSQFTLNNKEHNKVYVRLYSNEDATDDDYIKEEIKDITIKSNGTGYTADIPQIEFGNLNTETTYYFRVFAYINNSFTQLYDNNSNNNEYITRTYSSTTLGKNEILKGITFKVKPTNYAVNYPNVASNDIESSVKTLIWGLDLKSKENYKIRFELYEPEIFTETNPETGEEITKTNYKAVNFDGTKADSCNINTIGKSDNGHIENCYISVDKDKLENINMNAVNINAVDFIEKVNKNQMYQFVGDDFVFGGNYYKLLVYAIPYTNNNYLEEQKVLLYEKEKLTTIDKSGLISERISIPTLEEPKKISLNEFEAKYKSDRGYYISFKPEINDDSKVIRRGEYTARLKDANGIVIEEKTKYNQTAGIKETGVVNGNIEFTGLTSNTLYYVEILYNTFINNADGREKNETISFSDFIYTPISDDITLGNITAGNATSETVTLAYNGSSANLSEKIVGIVYTITLKGGSSRSTGYYAIKDLPIDPIANYKTNTTHIFNTTTDKIPKFTIDVTKGNQNFNFKTGNTYIITTQYYYLDDNNNILLLRDQTNNNTTYTTMLNL